MVSKPPFARVLNSVVRRRSFILTFAAYRGRDTVYYKDAIVYTILK